VSRAGIIRVSDHGSIRSRRLGRPMVPGRFLIACASNSWMANLPRCLPPFCRYGASIKRWLLVVTLLSCNRPEDGWRDFGRKLENRLQLYCLAAIAHLILRHGFGGNQPLRPPGSE
jgi:hypothetical protein